MRKALSVKEFSQYIKSNIKHDPIFQRVLIKGELSNIRQNNSHLYFSLKEDYDVIDCVFYYYEDFGFDFEPGKEVIVAGNLSFNNYSSSLIVVAKDLEDVGLSKEYRDFLKMKEDFRKKGYFDKAHKKPIDKLVKSIGLITSKDGAAIVDFLAMLNQRPNSINVLVKPVRVQGKSSSKEVAEAIESLDRKDLDVIVVTRGGGSSEDLKSFNQKDIIEAVYAANTPIISAIGHNIDTTLIDLVSDLSLQTPTEAGSYLISFYEDYKKELESKFERAKRQISSQLSLADMRLRLVKSRLLNLGPKSILIEKESKLKSLDKDLKDGLKTLFSYNESRLRGISSRLKYTEKIIELRKKEIKIIKKEDRIYSAHSLSQTDEIKIKFSDGEVLARIIDG